MGGGSIHARKFHGTVSSSVDSLQQVLVCTLYKIINQVPGTADFLLRPELSAGVLNLTHTRWSISQRHVCVRRFSWDLSYQLHFEPMIGLSEKIF